MKFSLSSFIMLCIMSIFCNLGHAQWTNSGSNLHTTDNVGINTSSPSVALDVVGVVKGTRTGGPATFILNRTDGKAVSVAAGTSAGTFRFDETGVFKVQSQPVAGLLAGNATGIIDVVTIESAPKHSMFLKSNGYLGIGTKTPLELLHVEGNARVDGEWKAYFPSNPGLVGCYGGDKFSIGYAFGALTGSASGINIFDDTGTSANYNVNGITLDNFISNTTINTNGACINCSTTINNSAALDIQSTDKGVLIPRLSNTSAVSSPATGLLIFDNSENGFKYYDGSSWQVLGFKISTTGNIFTGTDSGTAITTGDYNVGYSNTALQNITTGNGNAAIGWETLLNNTEGNNNIAIGRVALRENTTGDNNIAIGYNTLRYNETGVRNTSVGRRSMNNNTAGNDNTALGDYALSENIDGDNNVAAGSDALKNNTIGSNNTAIGTSAYLNGSYTNSTAVGYNSAITANNQIRLGDNAITSIGGYANWSNISDARLKKAVKQDVPGLAFITALNPVTYQMDMDAIAKWHKTPDSLRLADSEAAKAKIRYTGFLAQEVAAAAKEVGYDFSGVDMPESEEDSYALRYAEFVVPLVKAVQDLDKENGILKAGVQEQNREIKNLKEENKLQNEENEILKTNNAGLAQRLERLEALVANLATLNNVTTQTSQLSSARLDQNQPNPFKEETRIPFFIPTQVQQAYLQVTSLTGQVIKQIPITARGEGELLLDTRLLGTGTYQYSLVLDKKIQATKTMLLVAE